MKSSKPHQIQINMTGKRPLYEAQVLKPVLAALQSSSMFAVDTWGLDERSNFPYTEERVLQAANGQSSPYVLQLKRKRAIRHTTLARLSQRPALILNAHPTTPASRWPAIFDLADDLAAAYQPEMAWVHIFMAQEPPLASEEEKLHFRLDSGVTGSGPIYDDTGPGGLGLRTYFGPDLIERFGRDLLLRTPAQVTELPWGGLRIDLVAQPWHASLPDVLAAWQAAMNHLRPAELLSEFEVDEDGSVYFSPAANW